jgi:hypothetical protein
MYCRETMADRRRHPPRPAAAVGTAAILLT